MGVSRKQTDSRLKVRIKKIEDKIEDVQKSWRRTTWFLFLLILLLFVDYAFCWWPLNKVFVSHCRVSYSETTNLGWKGNVSWDKAKQQLHIYNDIVTIKPQELNFDSNTNVLSLTDGNSVDLSSLKTNYEAGNGLLLQGNTFVIDSPACSANEKLIWNGSSFVCMLDLIGGSTGGGYQTLSLSGTTLTISNGNSVNFAGWDTNANDDVKFLNDLQDVITTGVVSGQVLKWNGSSWVPADDNDTLGALTCNNGEIAKWNGNSWACAADSGGSSYTAGNGLTLSGAEFSIDSPTCANGEVLTWDGTSFSCVSDADTLAGLSCASGQIAKWNGSGWVCATDEDTDTTYTASGTLLQLSGTTFSVREGTLTNNMLCTYSTTDGLVCNTDASNVGTDNQTLSLSGNTLAISGGNSVDLSQFMDNTDSQTLSLSNNNLSISNGNSVDLSGYLDNTDDQTVDVFEIQSNVLHLSLEDDGQPDYTVDLSGYLDNTDQQTLSLSGTTLSISNGNSVDFTGWDTDASDDVQNIGDLNDVDTSTNAPNNGDLLSWNGSNWVPITSSSVNENIYTADGALTGERTVNLDGNNLLFTGSGNIGLGTTNPVNKLQVVGNVRATRFVGSDGTQGSPTFRFDSDSDTGMFRGATNELAFTTGGAERVRIDNQGFVGIGVSNPERPFHIRGSLTFMRADRIGTYGAAWLLTRMSDSTTVASSWMFGPSNVGGTSNDAFSIIDYGTSISGTSGTPRLVIEKNTGNVGLSTVSPAYRLDVSGTGRFTDDLTLDAGLIDSNGDVGTAGQVLTSTGSATDWQDVSTLSLGSITQHSDVDTSTNAPMNGQVLKWDGSNWIPGDDADTLASLSCSNDQVAKWNGSSWVCASDEDTDTLAGLSCSNGQVAKWNGSSWVCASDNDTTYNAGNGLQLSGTQFSVDSPTCTGTDKLTWNGSQFVCSADVDTDTTYSAGTGLSLLGTTFSLNAGINDLNDVDTSTNPPTNNQVLTWDGSNWVPADTQVHTGTTGSIFFANATNGEPTEDNANLFWDDTNNRLGVLTNSPAYSLDVLGTGRFTDTLHTANILPLADDTYDIGSSTLRYRDLYLGPSSLHIGTDGNEGIIRYDINENYLAFDPDSDTTPDMVITDNGLVGVGVTTPSARVHSYYQLTNESGIAMRGNQSITIDQTLGSVIVGRGGAFTSEMFNDSDTLTYSIGAWVSGGKAVGAGHTDPGYVNGLWTQSFLREIGGHAHEGTLHDLFGNRIQFGMYGTTNTGSVEFARGVFVAPYAQSGTIENLYDVYLRTLEGDVANVNNYFAIYQEDNRAKSYFAGNVGIGTDTPEYPLTIRKSVDGEPVRGEQIEILGIVDQAGPIHHLGIKAQTYDRVEGDTELYTKGGYWVGYKIVNDSSATDSGYVMGSWVEGLVRSLESGLVHAGSLAQVIGERVNYGIYGTGHTGSVDNAYGLFIQSIAQSGSITNAYGIFLPNIQGDASNITNYYGIYQADPDARNYFAGNVGIGTNDPETELEVVSPGHAVGSYARSFNVQGTDGHSPYGYTMITGGILDYTTTRVITQNGGMDGFSGITLDATGLIYFVTGTGLDSGDVDYADSIRMTIKEDGKVGIGTTGPQSLLHVLDGDTTLQNGYLFIKDNSSADSPRSGADWAPFVISRTTPYIRLHDTDRGQVDWVIGNNEYSSNNVNTQFRIAVLDDDTDVVANNAMTMDWDETNNEVKTIIFPSGDMGIGSLTPASTLDVKGTVTISGFDSNWSSNSWHKAIEMSQGDIIVWDKGSSGVSYGIGSSSNGVLYFGHSDEDDDSSPAVYDMVITGGNVGIGTTNPWSYKLYVNGTAYSTGGWQSSDVRWKKDIRSLDDALSIVEKLEPVKFKFRQEDYPDIEFPEGEQIGLIAQDVERYLPEVVHTSPDGYKAIAYQNLTVLNMQALKELDTKVGENKFGLENINTLLTGEPDNIDSETVQNMNSLLKFFNWTDDILTISKKLVVKAMATFKNTVRFLGQVIFEKEVTFKKAPVVKDKDMAGRAVIKANSDSVKIEFEREFSSVPIVSVTHVGDSFVQYTITDVSTKGFTIKIKDRAREEEEFNWIVLNAPDAPIYESESSQNQETTTPTPTPTATPTPTSTSNPEVNDSDDSNSTLNNQEDESNNATTTPTSTPTADSEEPESNE